MNARDDSDWPLVFIALAPLLAIPIVEIVVFVVGLFA